MADDQLHILALIKMLAPQHDLPWELVAAICTVESSMDPWQVKYEPAYKYLYGNEAALTATERMQQMTSWGIAQVMGAVAREYGYQGWLSRLCIPEVGLNYGMLHLVHYHTHYADWDDVISSYNAGSPRKANGLYLNQSYVNKVLASQDLFARQVTP